MDNSHIITVYDKKRVNATTVLEVLAFSEKEVKFRLTDKSTLLIAGNNLKIVGFDNNTGNASIIGDIISIKYKTKEDSFLKKVFK